MFKKYRFLIFFCFLVMLTGVSLLSIDKVEHVLVEDDNQESSNAASNKCWLVMNTNIRDKNGTGLIGMNIELYLSSGYSGDYNWKYHFYTYSTYVGGTREGSLDQVWLQFYRGICIETTCDYTGRKTTWVGYKGTDSSNSNVYGELLNSSIVKIEADGTNLGEVTMGSLTTNGFKKDKKYGSDTAAPTFTLTFYPKILYNFDYNGGKSDGKTNASIIYDSKDNHMELWDGTEKNNIAVPVRDGYTFKGYYTAKTGGSQIINANGKWTGTWNLSNVRCAPLYAQWTVNTYTVSYNLDGGTQGTYQPTSWTYDVAQRISNPTRTGYAFTGWTASSLSTSTAVYGTSSSPTTKWSNANTKVIPPEGHESQYFKNLRTTSGTVTLKANWSPIEYTLTYNPNGGSVSPDGKKVFYNSAYGDLPTPTRTGYTFTGWYTAETGGIKVSSTTKMTTAGATIYAHWTANTYTVKFNDQGGTTNFADMVLLAESTYNTDGTYTFTRNGVTGTYDVSDSVLTLNGTPTNDFNLFINLGLHFTQNDVYKVSYQKISGSMSGSTTGCFVLEVCASDWTNLATRNRVDFQMNNSSGSVNLTISSSGATNGAGLKLWFWCNETGTPSRVFNNFKVKFKIEKSGTQNVQKQTRFTYDSPLEGIAPPTRVGYNFQGYYTQTGGGGTRYFDSSGHPVVSTMNIANNTTTLHAYWTAKTDCVLTFNANEGTVSPASRNQTFNAALGTLPVPTRTGYIFTGWYTSASGGSEVTSSTIMKSESMTIYAHWADTWGNHYSTVSLKPDTSSGFWMISTSEELARVIYLLNYTARTDVLTMKFKLTNHIDMSDYCWLPIGTETRPFGGVIDGQGYTIKGLHTIPQSMRKDNGGDNSGFIGVASGATIKNIYFDGIQINGKNHVGAVIGYVIGSNKTNVSGIAVKNYGTKIGERIVEATGAKGVIVGYSKISQKAVVRDCLGVQETNYEIYFQIASVDCKDSIGYKKNGSSYTVSKTAASSVGFANWVSVAGLPFQLPKGLAWIASGG